MSKTFTSINPATMQEIGRYDVYSADAIEDVVQAVSQRFVTWRTTSLQERSDHLLDIADQLEQQKEELAALMTAEMGKPIRQARSEIDKCAWVCRYYAEYGAGFLEPQEIALDDASRGVVAYQALGPILAIMPWNFPFWQVFRFAAPNLMLGNTCLLKHAANVSGCALAIEELMRQAELPEDCFRSLLIDSDQAQQVISDRRVRAVTLTGSSQAGSAVAAAAGRVRKKAVLELGGSDPYVILADADLELAAEQCVSSRLINSGQSCIAAKRFIVEASIAKAFTELVCQKVQAKVVGDPTREDCDVGPLARADLKQEVADQVKRSTQAGARPIYTSKLLESSECFHPLVVLTDVTPEMACFNEEVFGPVAVIVTAESETEAIELANQSSFGLGGAVFSRDLDKAEYIAREELEVGSCAINGFVKSDPRLPFGGIKDSGFGRELGSEGLREFANIKTIVRPIS